MPAPVAAFDPAAAFRDLTAEAEVTYTEHHGELEDLGEGDWREVPVDLTTFVQSPEHLNLPPLYDLQFEAMIELLGADPTRIFEAPDPGAEAARMYQLAVLLWGKGSGKDYLCSVIVAYLVYVLLCLRNPAVYLEQAPGEYLDIVNVAYNADQAQKVFFAKFKERLFRWRWLRENFDVHDAGRRKWAANKGLPKVEINAGDVIFPRGIRCFSRHSQNESYEGLNVIVWLMDEASAFLSAAKKENAGAIYQTLRTSAGSRFGRRWLGFIISYPRHADDFTMQKCREAKQHPEAGILGHGPYATWEVNEGRGRDERVEVRPGHYVPVSLANDYVLDFEQSLAKYECQPPLAKDALIKDHDRVWAAVQRGRAPMIEWEEVINHRTTVDAAGEDVQRTYAGVKLTRLGKLPRRAKLFLHGDPARTSDAFAVAIGHGVPATIMLHVPAGEVLTDAQIIRSNAGAILEAQRTGEQPRIITAETLVPWERDVTRTVIDALIVWRPDPKVNRHVDLLNVKDVLQQLVEHYGIGAWGGISFDQYDSAELVQWLEKKRLPVENEQWSNPFQHRIYRGARSALYNDLVSFPDHPTITSEDARQPGAIYELLRVEEIEGHKIDHPEGGSKDLADAVVRIIEHVTAQAMAKFSYGTLTQKPSDPSGGLSGATRRVDPHRTQSLATPAMKEADAVRAQERPEGELEPSTGTVRSSSGSRFSYGTAR